MSLDDTDGDDDVDDELDEPDGADDGRWPMIWHGLAPERAVAVV